MRRRRPQPVFWQQQPGHTQTNPTPRAHTPDHTSVADAAAHTFPTGAAPRPDPPWPNVTPSPRPAYALVIKSSKS